MKITRKINIYVKTQRNFIVRRKAADGFIFCERCAEPMTAAQMSAAFFGFSSRIIIRLIEAGRVHFVETEHHEVYVCLLPVKRILDWGTKKKKVN